VPAPPLLRATAISSHLVLAHDAFGERLGFEERNRVGLLARPRFFLLAAALVLRVRRRVALEPKGVHLQDGGAVEPDVVHDRAAALEGLAHVLAVYQQAGHAVVLALQRTRRERGRTERKGQETQFVLKNV
jgi:hypothetical protein